jgi:hypothetical protein
MTRQKQPCLHGEYLPPIDRGNIILVDTHRRSVEQITESNDDPTGVMRRADAKASDTPGPVVSSRAKEVSPCEP